MFFSLLFVVIVQYVYGEISEPKCMSSFDYNHQLLYKLIKVEEQVKSFEAFIEKLQQERDIEVKEHNTRLEELKEERDNEAREHNKRLEEVLGQLQEMSQQHLNSLTGNSSEVMWTLQQSATTLQTKVEALTKLPAVGFTVTDPKATATSGHVSFDAVVTNKGEGFDTATGLFTCETPGYYYLSVSILKSSSHTSYTQCYIYKNNKKLVLAYTDPGHSPKGGFYAATNSVFVHLERGDTVKVAGCTSMTSLNSYTSLSGFLVAQDGL